MTGPSVNVRPALPADLAAIDRIEASSFSGDRLSRRALKYLLNRARAINLVAVQADRIVGYIIVLVRRGSTSARVYSLAVDPIARGARVGARLLEAAERSILARGLDRMHLEVRADNGAAIHRYREAGYVQFAEEAGYYEDGETALKFSKPLRTGT